jgi:uncharacterized protein YjbI with pentapeptide repeats
MSFVTHPSTRTCCTRRAAPPAWLLPLLAFLVALPCSAQTPIFGGSITSATIKNATYAGGGISGGNLSSGTLVNATLTDVVVANIDVTAGNQPNPSPSPFSLAVTSGNVTKATITGGTLTGGNYTNVITVGGKTYASLTGAVITNATLTDVELTGGTFPYVSPVSATAPAPSPAVAAAVAPTSVPAAAPAPAAPAPTVAATPSAAATTPAPANPPPASNTKPPPTSGTFTITGCLTNGTISSAKLTKGTVTNDAVAGGDIAGATVVNATLSGCVTPAPGVPVSAANAKINGVPLSAGNISKGTITSATITVASANLTGGELDLSTLPANTTLTNATIDSATLDSISTGNQTLAKALADYFDIEFGYVLLSSYTLTPDPANPGQFKLSSSSASRFMIQGLFQSRYAWREDPNGSDQAVPQWGYSSTHWWWPEADSSLDYEGELGFALNQSGTGNTTTPGSGDAFAELAFGPSFYRYKSADSGPIYTINLPEVFGAMSTDQNYSRALVAYGIGVAFVAGVPFTSNNSGNATASGNGTASSSANNIGPISLGEVISQPKLEFMTRLGFAEVDSLEYAGDGDYGGDGSNPKFAPKQAVAFTGEIRLPFNSTSNVISQLSVGGTAYEMLESHTPDQWSVYISVTLDLESLAKAIPFPSSL